MESLCALTCSHRAVPKSLWLRSGLLPPPTLGFKSYLSRSSSLYQHGGRNPATPSCFFRGPHSESMSGDGVELLGPEQRRAGGSAWSFASQIQPSAGCHVVVKADEAQFSAHAGRRSRGRIPGPDRCRANPKSKAESVGTGGRADVPRVCGREKSDR